MASTDGFYWSVPKSGPNKGKKLWHYIPQKNLLAGTGWVSWDQAPPELRARFTRGQYTEKWDEGPVQQVATGRGPGDNPALGNPASANPLGMRKTVAPNSTGTDQGGMVSGLTNTPGFLPDTNNPKLPDWLEGPTDWVGDNLDKILKIGGVVGGVIKDRKQDQAREDAIAVSEEERKRLIDLSTQGMAGVRGLQFNKPDLGQVFYDPTNVFNRSMVRPMSSGTNGNPPQTYGNPAGDQYSSGNPNEQRNTGASPLGGAPTSMGTPIVPPLQFADPEEIRRREEEERLRRGY